MRTNWILLSDARNNLLRIWNTATVLALLFLLAQQIGGMLAGIEAPSWSWFFSCFFPGLLLLNLNAWLRRRADKVLSPGAYRTLLGLASLYLSMLILALIASRAVIDANDYGLDTYYQKTLWVLLPFNLLLTAGFTLVFYTRESLFKPSPAIVLELAASKAAAAKQHGRKIQIQIYETIRENKIPAALEQAVNWFEQYDTGNHQNLLLLQSRYHTVREMLDLNTISPTEAQIELNKITVALIDLIGSIRA